jgi:putative heme-binding domain-containing protein
VKLLSLTASLIALCGASSVSADTISLFDGKTLRGWRGDKTFWSVQDGAITGESTVANPCKQTTYLTYMRDDFANFELIVDFRLIAEKGNSGIQYRSQWHNKDLFQIKGYQADLETGDNYSGIFYEQNGRGIVAKQGQHVVIAADGKKKVTPLADATSAQKAQASIKRGEWNTYRIVADGHTLTHQINGHTVSTTEDNDPKKRASTGLLAFQMHQGPAMKVQYKNVRMLELPDSPTTKAGSSPAKNAAKASDSQTIKSLPGFRVTQLHSVNKKTEGSWTSMCFDDHGKLYVCDQYGSLYRITLKNGKIANKEALASPGKAQGLCWAFGSLYLNSHTHKVSGLYRLTDTNKDGSFDKTEHIIPLPLGGEHGPHGIVKTADGKGLYVVLGNHTPAPATATSTSKKNWAEDTLHPHLPDARGHASHVKAPGGTLLRISPDGKKQEIISSGMRNTYDIALSPTGDIFGYDSDMEYDIGSPWYKPTRVLHLIDGADFGWRTGTSKWPAYYADSLGSVNDIGPGCPTGVLFGTNAKFPLKYRKALYVLDWTFGRMYALHLKPDGSTYTADRESFISGKPLPLTDAVIGPDGAMYFLTGGRRLQSALYRVDYIGKESTQGTISSTPSKTQNQLLQIQQSREVKTLWPALASTDRTLRYAARVSLETLPATSWSKQFKNSTDPQTIITASLAIARGKGDRQLATSKLLSLDFTKLTLPQQLEYLRASSLVFIRLGTPDAATKASFADRLDSSYPSADAYLNRELCRVLVYLDSAQVVAKSTLLMRSSVAVKEDLSSDLLKGNDRYSKDFNEMLKNQPDAQAMHYALMLKNAKVGWTPTTVTAYYTWLNKAESKSGGKSYKGFIGNIRKEAIAKLPANLKAIAEKTPKYTPPATPMPTAKGPGRMWTMETALAAVADLTKANAGNGQKMFQATLCAQCHTHTGVGGNSGPELSNLGGRFGKKDILTAIINPSEVISDQYNFSVLHLKDKSQVYGRILKEDATHVFVASSAFNLSMQTPIEKSKIVKRTASPVSPMPPSLINSLNPDELRDLMLFLTGK